MTVTQTSLVSFVHDNHHSEYDIFSEIKHPFLTSKEMVNESVKANRLQKKIEEQITTFQTAKQCEIFMATESTLPNSFSVSKQLF